MASTVQKNCIKVAIKSGNIELATRLALLANIESGDMVYLDNAKSDCEAQGMNAHQFAGGLASLQAKGFYQQKDGHFGQVNI